MDIITKEKRNLEEILPILDATLVMRRDAIPELVLETEAPSIKKKSNIPQVMRNMNSTGEDEDHTLIHISTWIRSAVVNEHTNKDFGHKDQEGVHPPNKQR